MLSAPLTGGDPDTQADHVRLGVVTVSDRASAGIYDDLSGPAILEFFHEAIRTRCDIRDTTLLHDI